MSFRLVLLHHLFHSFLCFFGEKRLGQFLANVSHSSLRGMAEVGGVEAVVA